MQQVRESSPGPRASRSRSRRSTSPTPGPGEAVVADPGLRGLPHRPALPRGRHQRRLPVPARPRGRRRRRGGRRRASTDVAPGDFVVLNWRAVCGNCRACTRGEPWYCFATHNATQKMTLEDGTELSPALGIGAFAEKTLVAAGQCTKVDPSARPAAVGLLGCGVMAGLGAAINTGNVGRGKSVAVIGCGGVGAAAIAGLRAGRRGARSSPSTSTPQKLEWRHAGWAPRTPSNSTDADPVEAIQALTGGNGADVVIDAVGRPETWKQAFYARDLAGTVVLVGVPTPGHEDPRHPADRRLRPRRRAEVQLVRRLPARRATSRCWSTSTSRAGSTSTPSSPRRSASTTSRRRSRRCTTATCCARVVIF